ncbi:MAG: hypothetical protein IT290_11595 [Deltaproteobacteria bacterium]|nr:hypothetical protein [Deltaproteobacteria bacterium]
MTSAAAHLLSPVIAFHADRNLASAARASWVDEILLPALQLVERSPLLVVNLSISTAILEWLIDKDFHGAFRSLTALHQAGRIDLLLPFADEPSSILSATDTAHHLEFSKRAFTTAGLKLRGGCSALFPNGEAGTAAKAGAAIIAAQRFLVTQSTTSPSWVGVSAGAQIFSLRPGAGPIEGRLDGTRALSLVAPLLSQSISANNLSILSQLEALSTGNVRPILLADLAGFQTATALELPPPAPDQPRRGPRRQEIRQRFAAATGQEHSASRSPAQRAHLEAAERFILMAESAFALESESLEADRLFFEAVISADVELDYYLHPDVDPTIGWVRPADAGAGRLAIDTQLARFLFLQDRHLLVEIDDKPRKINLVPQGPVDGSSPALGFFLASDADFQKGVGKRIAAPTTGNTPALLRSSPDVATLRLQPPVEIATAEKSKPADVQVTIDFSARSGVGAHLTNSTTGFTVEYWVDAEAAPKGVYAVIELSLVIPSTSGVATTLKPLTSVGGVSALRFPGDARVSLTTANVEGGLHGVRLIDGIDSYVVDLRSAKPLNAVEVLPLGKNADGLIIRLALDAARIYGDEKLNSLFVSIL